MLMFLHMAGMWVMRCRYDRKRHYDQGHYAGSDSYGYVGWPAKESRMSQSFVTTSDMTGSAPLPAPQFPLLMAPPTPWQTVPASEHTQSTLQHSDETVSSLPPLTLR